MKRAIDSATMLESLPATEAAVREGRLSARQAQLIASAAVHDPSTEAELIERAADGLTRLSDACVRVRPRVEDPEVDQRVSTRPAR